MPYTHLKLHSSQALIWTASWWACTWWWPNSLAFDVLNLQRLHVRTRGIVVLFMATVKGMNAVWSHYLQHIKSGLLFFAAGCTANIVIFTTVVIVVAIVVVVVVVAIISGTSISFKPLSSATAITTYFNQPLYTQICVVWQFPKKSSF